MKNGTLFQEKNFIYFGSIERVRPTIYLCPKSIEIILSCSLRSSFRYMIFLSKLLEKASKEPLTLKAPTPQNGQTHSNNSSAADEFFECIWPFGGFGAGFYTMQRRIQHTTKDLWLSFCEKRSMLCVWQGSEDVFGIMALNELINKQFLLTKNQDKIIYPI